MELVNTLGQAELYMKENILTVKLMVKAFFGSLMVRNILDCGIKEIQIQKPFHYMFGRKLQMISLY